MIEKKLKTTAMIETIILEVTEGTAVLVGLHGNEVDGKRIGMGFNDWTRGGVPNFLNF